MTDLSSMVRSVKAGNKLEFDIRGVLGRGVEPVTSSAASAKLVAALIGGEHQDRARWFHPSQSGQCGRRQMFDFIGAAGEPVDSKLQAIFLDGHWRHLKWQIMLLDAGLITEAERKFVDHELTLTGSADGVREGEWLLEIKGTSKFRAIGEPLPEHLRQIHGYFLLSGYRDARLLYECKAYQDFKVFDVRCDDSLLADVRAEYEQLSELERDGKMPAVLDECERQEGAFVSCPYRKSCLTFGDWMYPQL